MKFLKKSKGLRLNPKKIFAPGMTLLQLAKDLYQQMKLENPAVLIELNILSAGCAKLVDPIFYLTNDEGKGPMNDGTYIRGLFMKFEYNIALRKIDLSYCMAFILE